MHVEKIFNPILVAKTIFIPRTIPEAADKMGARNHALLLAEGITIWLTIDIIVFLTIFFVSLFVQIPLTVIASFTAFAVVCPLIMTLGIGYTCLQHLKVKETWEILRDYFQK